MTFQRLCVMVGVAAIFTGVFWNGPVAWGHYLALLAALWIGCALVDVARIWRLNR